MDDKHIRWEWHEPPARNKSANWYWTVGIIAVGVAVASIVAQNFLFGILALIGGFAVMLAGSHRGGRRVFIVSERGVHVGADVVPHANITRFAIKEDEPRALIVETKSLLGTVSLHLGDTDFRAIRTELKNHNVEEVDELHPFGERLAKAIGM